MRRLIPALAVAITLATTPALAGKGPENIGIGAGMVTCQSFNKEYLKTPVIVETLALIWGQGFMTATNIVHNYQNTTEKDLNGWTQDRQKAKLRSYCSDHPLDRVIDAVLSLYNALPDAPQQTGE